jgi:hypothetical protein
MSSGTNKTWREWVEPDALAEAKPELAARDMISSVAKFTTSDGSKPFIYALNAKGFEDIFRVLNSSTGAGMPVPEAAQSDTAIALVFATSFLNGRSGENPLMRDSMKDLDKIANEDYTAKRKITDFVKYLQKEKNLNLSDVKLVDFQCRETPSKSLSLLLLYCDEQEVKKFFNTVLPELQELGELSQTSRGPGTSR